MKRTFSYAIALILAISCAYAAPKKDTSKAQWLFVMRAETASLTKTDKGFELTLKNTLPNVLYFSDRPVRKAGLMPTAIFMKDWLNAKSSFQADPPNAALLFETGTADKNGVIKAVAVELKNPQMISDGSWTFQVSDLEGKLIRQ